MITSIETRLLKYIPKQLHPYIVWLDSYKCGPHQWNYSIVLRVDGKEISPDFVDSVKELRSLGKWLIPYVTGEKDYWNY